MHAVERAKRRLLQAVTRAEQEGLFFETWGNLSCRPTVNRVVITPSGIAYQKLRSPDLVVVNLAGKTLRGRWKPSTELLLHLAIYNQRKEVKAIIHTHSLYAAAFAVCRTGIPVVLEELAQVAGGAIKVAAYAPPGSKELAENVLAALGGEGQAVLLANHGLVSLGTDLPAALQRCRVIERNARVILWAKILGQPHILSPAEVAALRKIFLEHYGQAGSGLHSTKPGEGE